MAGQVRAQVIQEGKASWYGTTSHGRKTASGRIFSRDEYTAAHRSLPFGTVVRVHNTANGENVLVAITDRGPFVKNRVVDLSRRAAGNLNMIDAGIVPVVLEVVSDRSGKPLNQSNSFYLKLARADSAQSAHQLSAWLETILKVDIRAFELPQSVDGEFALCVGPFETFTEAEQAFSSIDRSHQVLAIIEAPTEGGTVPGFAPPPDISGSAQAALGFGKGNS